MARITRVTRFKFPPSARSRFLKRLMRVRDVLEKCPAAHGVTLLEAPDGELLLYYHYFGPEGGVDCARCIDARFPPEERYALMLKLKVQMSARSYRAAILD